MDWSDDVDNKRAFVGGGEACADIDTSDFHRQSIKEAEGIAYRKTTEIYTKWRSCDIRKLGSLDGVRQWQLRLNEEIRRC